jgi:hypothetical protein
MTRARWLFAQVVPASARRRVSLGCCLTACLLVAGIHGQQSVSTATPADGVVSGHAVSSTTGRGIAGAEVALTPIRDWQTAAGDLINDDLSDAQAQARGMTKRRVMASGSDGAFVFTETLPGTYSVIVRKTGFVTGSVGTFGPGWDTGRLAVAAGQHVDVGAIRLVPLPVLTGHIDDERADPIIGVEVHALRRELLAGETRYADVASTKTDDRGEYRFTSLKPADYVVAVPAATISTPKATMDAHAEDPAGVAAAAGRVGSCRRKARTRWVYSRLAIAARRGM